MPDRFLVEEQRAIRQILAQMQADIRTLKKRSAFIGAVRSDGLVQPPPGIPLVTDGRQTVLIEFQIDPGKWVVFGQLHARYFHNPGVPQYEGQEQAQLLTYAIPQSHLGDTNLAPFNIAEGIHAPLATPVPLQPLTAAAWQEVISFGIAESESESMTLRLIGSAFAHGDVHVGTWTNYRMIAIPA